MDKEGGSEIYILLFLLMAACYFDYRMDKIPNALVLLGTILASVYRVTRCIVESRGTGGVIPALVTELGLLLLWMGIVFMVLYPFYMLGMLGAGDVKLYCMSAAFLKGKDCLTFFAGSMLLAAAIALLKLLYQKNIRERLYYFCSYLVDILRLGSFRLYFDGADWKTKRRASLHMAGPMLAGLLLHVCGVY
ncbi:MAG: prepilin peptidase [Lachnospiraceae bacterium]